MAWIVIVEDDEAQRELMQVALADLGYWDRVDALEDGEQALERLEAWCRSEPHPDLVLMDLKLPRRSGHEVLESLSARGLRPPMPVVVLSSSNLLSDRELAASVGASDYRIKPLGYVALVELLRSVSERWCPTAPRWA